VEEQVQVENKNRYYLQEIPGEFLSSERWLNVVDQILENLNHEIIVQDEIDTAYN
jgi:hypothetical protein